MKKKIINSLKANKYAFVAFFLPVFILVIVFAQKGFYPFGHQQLAIIDSYHQYIPFLSELQCRMKDGGSLFYSWNGAVGFNFWCLLSYYGASPLNILLLLFPKSLIIEGVSAILLLRFGLTGSFMYIFLKKVYRPENCAEDKYTGLMTALFACMYALCTFAIGYYWNFMWLDAVMLLPLLMLGLHQLIKDGRMALFTVVLAIIVFSNYYIASMVCIFILCYYPVFYFITVRGRGARECLATTVRAVGASLLGICMSAVMLLPAYISMKSTYYFSYPMPEKWELYYDVLDVINQLFPVSHLTYLKGQPNICCGFLVTMMLVCYFISGKINNRDKALSAAFLVFAFLSFNINKLDFIWHGMHFPIQLPHRFSFVVCFVIVTMAYQAFNRLSSISADKILTLFVVTGAYYVFAQKLLVGAVDNMNIFIYYGLTLTAVYGIVLMLFKRQRIRRRQFIALLAFIAAAELCVSTGIYFGSINNYSRDDYIKDKASVIRLARYAGKEGGAVSDGGDGRFARMEINDNIICNCPAFYHYRGISQFSSTINYNKTMLLKHIGLEGDPRNNTFCYHETSPVTNCITNIDYLIGKNRKLTDLDFTFIKKDGESSLYRSNYSLSLGYMLPESIRTWDPNDENPFINLDNYVKAATAGKVKKVFVNMGKGVVSGENTDSRYVDDCHIASSLRVPSESGTVEIKYKAKVNAKYYVYITADYADDVYIDSPASSERISVKPDRGCIRNIGFIKSGQEFKANVSFKARQTGRITCYVYTLDEAAWNKAYGMISSSLMTVTDATDTCIKGTIDAGRGGVLVTSIPYENGWKMKIDGRETPVTELTGDCWISAALDKGTHEIEFSFRPPGFTAGLLITIGSVLVLIAVTYLPAVLRRRRFLKEGADRDKE